MLHRSFPIALLTVVALNTAMAIEKIDLPQNTTHPERDAKRAIQRNDLGFIGVYGYAYTIPEVEGVYLYDRFAKNLYAQLKVVRGTSDVHSRNPDDINIRARAYAARYNRVLLDWLEAHHSDWLGPRQPLTHNARARIVRLSWESN
jgi:hypothetical protein